MKLILTEQQLTRLMCEEALVESMFHKGMSFQEIVMAVRKLGKKGLLTASVIANIVLAFGLNQAQKKALENIAGIEQAVEQRKKACEYNTVEGRWEKNPEAWQEVSNDALATVYNAVPGQCNNDVLHTASMFKLNLKDVLSQRVIAMERTFMKELGFHNMVSDGGFGVTINDALLGITPLDRDKVIALIDECKENNKGIFILVKTSNPSSADIQDKVDENGENIYESVAKHVKKCGEELIGETNYTSIGAVVGATFPKEALKLRKIMDNNIFLVPGYGAQGATAKDIINCFNEDGLGALINASRSIIYAYMKNSNVETCSKEEYIKSVKKATIEMREDIYLELKNSKNSLKY